jgi:hypothetical protein
MNDIEEKSLTMKKLVTILSIFILLPCSSAKAIIINDLVIDNDTKTVIRKIREDILDFQYNYIWRLYRNKEGYNTGPVAFYLYSVVLVNPDENLTQFKGIIEEYDNKKSLLDKESTEHYINIDGIDATRAKEMFFRYEIEMMKKNYKKAIWYLKKNIELKKKQVRDLKKNEREESTSFAIINDHLFKKECEIKIIKAILARKEGKTVKLEPERLKYLWDHPDIFKFNRIIMKRYVTMLIVFNEVDEFKKVFTRYPLDALKFRHHCKQRVEVYKEWLYQHKYWLTPEFKKAIEETWPGVLEKFDDCYFIKRLKMKNKIKKPVAK